MKYAAPVASIASSASATLPPSAFDKARTIAAGWPVADPGSLVATHGSVIISGLFSWADGDADPALELDVDEHLRLALVAHGRAVGFTRAEPSRPPQVAFNMRSCDSHGSSYTYVQLAPASARLLAALMPHALPCEDFSALGGRACGNFALSGSYCSQPAESPRCWLHDASLP